MLSGSWHTRLSLTERISLPPPCGQDHPGLQVPLGVLTFCKGIQATMVCRGLQVPQAHQALQDAKASQDVMGQLARKV